jgi:hypothetical protein
MNAHDSARRLIVLDKDFLVSVSAKEFRSLFTDYEFLITQNLIGECMQYLPDGSDATKQKRAINALRKFSEKVTAQPHIDGVGQLMSIEVDTRIPCWPLSDYVSSGIWFNPAYLNKELKLGPGHVDSLVGWHKLYVEKLSYEELKSELSLSPIFDWEPELQAIRKTSDVTQLLRIVAAKLPGLRSRISTDIELVRSHYRWCRPFRYPPPEKIDPRWVLFRRFQADMLQHLEAIDARCRSVKRNETNLIHDLRDYSYCIIAAQVGAIATNEIKQRERFLQMRPDGLVLRRNHVTGCVEEWR